MLHQNGPKQHIVSWIVAIVVHLLLFTLEFDVSSRRITQRESGVPIIEIDYIERALIETERVGIEEVAEEPEKRGVLERITELFQRERKEEVQPQISDRIDPGEIKKEERPREKLVDRSRELRQEDDLSLVERGGDPKLTDRESRRITDDRSPVSPERERDSGALTDRRYEVARGDLPFEVQDSADAVGVSGSRSVAIDLGERTSDDVVAPARSALTQRDGSSPSGGGEPGEGRRIVSQGRNRTGGTGAFSEGAIYTERQREIVSPSAGGPVVSEPEERTEQDGVEDESRRIYQLAGPLSDRRILNKIIPHYPDWAKREGIIASCTIRFEIVPAGTVRENLYVLRSSGFPRLDAIAMEALGGWMFEPKDIRQNEWGEITFYFRARFR